MGRGGGVIPPNPFIIMKGSIFHMNMQNLDKLLSLRAALHACPEVSGQEVRTRALLMDFLREFTSLELHPCGAGFYAAHREPNAARPAAALRADYDALATPEGAAHLCGHDGNAASLCGVALELEGQTLGRDVFLLFQPAEESGAGALPCCELFDHERVGEIYAAHTLPGQPLGRILTRPGTIACASPAAPRTPLIPNRACPPPLRWAACCARCLSSPRRSATLR